MPFSHASNLQLLTVAVGPSKSIKVFHDQEPCLPMSRKTESRIVTTTVVPDPPRKAPINSADAVSK